MGSDCEQNMKAIDASVGGLVWVRRRNGSWWPGRIMSVDELPESCLVSPRSGTPVKLLGREDASVDWYNLEKSKRVKAFRCGEYDECIEKAKASAANLGKKVVKYARREDAILHALELESACKTNRHQEFHFRKDESAGLEHDIWIGQSKKIFGLGKENEFAAGEVSAIEGSSTQELSPSGLSFEDRNHISSPRLRSMQKKRRKTSNDSEDDETEKTKRMRGLEDLGMGVVSKRKPSICHTDVSHELVQLDGASLSESNIVNGFSNGSPVNSSRDYCSSLRKRRSQVANVYESLKKKNRRRPLTKVLESTAMVAVPVVCDQGASPGGSSLQGLTYSKVSALESIESKKTSISVVYNNSDSTVVSCVKETSLNVSDHTCDAGVDAFPFHSEMRDNEFSSPSEIPDNDSSESLFDVPFVGEEKHTGGFSPLFACSSRKLPSGAGARESNHYSQVQTISLRTEGLDESGSTSVAALVNNVSRKIEKGASKWQLKGKRNSRKLSKKTNTHLDSMRPRDSDDQSDGFLVGVQHMDEFPACYGQKVEIGTFDRCLTSDNNCSQLAKYRLVPDGLGDRSHHRSNEISHREMRIGQPCYLDSSKYGGQKLVSKDVAILTTDGKERYSVSHEKSVVGKSTTHMRCKEPLLTRRMPVSSLRTQRLLPQLQSHFTPYSRYQIADAPIRNISGGSSLYDVKLDVRTSYRGQHVPLVSLMSKLNGKAIIGHPITVEVLDDSYCDLSMSDNDCCPASSSCELYDAPRENLLGLSTDAPKKLLLLDGVEGTGGALQALTGSAVQSHVEYPRNPVKHSTSQPSLSPKKSPKIRKCGILSKKTRRLSSFAVTHEPGEEKRKPVVEKLGGPVIACVPLKVVFSRINEAVNSSSRSAHRGPTSSNP